MTLLVPLRISIDRRGHVKIKCRIKYYKVMLSRVRLFKVLGKTTVVNVAQEEA